MDNNEIANNSKLTEFNHFWHFTRNAIKINAIWGAVGGFLASITTMSHGNGERMYNFFEFVAINTTVGVCTTVIGFAIGGAFGSTWFVTYPMFFASCIAYKMK